MVGWHYQLKGHAIEQTPGHSEGQGSLASCSPRGHKESDTTEQQLGKQLPPYVPPPASRSPFFTVFSVLILSEIFQLQLTLDQCRG